MTVDSYPRILILCQNKIQPFTGGGVVLSNLFHEFPTDRLIFFHRDQDYRFESPYREYRVTGRWLRPRPLAVLAAVLRWLLQVAGNPRRARLRDLVALLVQNSRVSFPVGIGRVMDAFRPQVIYAWTGDSLWTEVVAAAVRRCRVACVIHFMDNHAGLQPETPLDCTLHPAFLRRLGLAVAGAAVIYTISDSMGQAYQALFGKRYEVFHGLLDTAAWPRRPPRPAGRPFTLVFTGSIERGQMLGLADVAAAVDRLAADGMAIRLVLYLTDQYKRLWAQELAKYACIEVRRHPSFDQLADVLAEADLLVLAYGFDERTINYYRYSFATKIVPYMLSGTCILAYGPTAIEPIAYARRGGWAAVVDERDVDALADRIAVLVGDADQCARLAAAAYEAGLAEHDLTRNAKRFRDSLLTLAALPAMEDVK